MKLTKFNKIAYLPILAFLSISNIASACDSTAADCPALVRASEMREMAKGRFVWVKGGNSYLTAVDTHAAHNIGVALGDKEMGSYAPINDKTERHGTWNVCKYMGGN